MTPSDRASDGERMCRYGAHLSADLLGAGMLPERLRTAFGYRWGRRDRASYEALISLVRITYRTLPGSIRFLPGYRGALARAQGAC